MITATIIIGSIAILCSILSMAISVCIMKGIPPPWWLSR